MKRLVLLFGIVFFLSFVNAVTLNQGVVLNSTVSNSSVNFSLSVNVSNFTIESNYVSLVGVNFTNSTGSYTCDDVNHSVENFMINGSGFNCSLVVVVAEEAAEEVETVGGSTGVWTGIREQENVEENKLMIIVSVLENIPLVKEIESSLTGVREMEINANGRIYGTIEFEVLEEVPSGCEIDEGYLVYELFEINEDFNISKVESIRLKYGVDKDWVRDNDVEDVVVIKCLPFYELLDVKKVNESVEEEYYNIYSSSFSTWVVLGGKEEALLEEDLASVEDVSVVEDDCFDERWFWLLILVGVVIILIIIFIIKKRKRKK